MTRRSTRAIGLQRSMRRAAREATRALGERVYAALVEDPEGDHAELLRREARRCALEIVGDVDHALVRARKADRDEPARRTHAHLACSALEVAVSCGELPASCSAADRVRQLYREAVDEVLPTAAQMAAEDAGDDADAQGEAIARAIRDESARAVLEILHVARSAKRGERAEADGAARAAVAVLGTMGRWLREAS